MKVSRRVIRYAKDNYNEVFHTTLNPEGPGVVRIHLIPPEFDEASNELDCSVAIINGQDIIPVNTSWSVLLSEFIRGVNRYSGREIDEKDTKQIVDNTCQNVRRVFPFVSKKVLRNDIVRIMTSFTQIAYGLPVDEAIEYISLSEYASSMSAPHRMDLMVSSMLKNGSWHCNQKCVHCYAAGQKQAEENELTTEEWKRILEKCKIAKIPQVTFTGGEPTMRDDLVELVEAAKWFVTRLNTNGIKLTKELCNQLMKASLDSIQITFYSDERDIHNALVGSKTYDNTVEGIRNAIEAGLSVSINTPLCTLNRDYPKTLKFLAGLGVKFVTCSGLITTGNASKSESENLQLTGEELKEILVESMKVIKSERMEISFTSPGWIEDEFFKLYGLSTPSCGACLSNMAVTPSGNVVPCQSWLSGDVLGNMLDDNWNTIWNSDRCKERRNFSASVAGICPLRRHND